MDAIVDASTLISLAWSGSLWLIEKSPVGLRVPGPVRDEVVVTGIARGYADAAAIETSIKDLPAVPVDVTSNVDAAVLNASISVGALVCNDVALGRRASNLGVVWLRTADLVVLTVKAGAVRAQEGRDVLDALRAAGRITDELLQEYLKELS